MKSAPTSSRRLYLQLLFSLFSLLVVASPCLAQGKGKKEDMEQFEEVCPYTKGQRELEKKLGYARMGLIPWRRGQSSKDVQETLGGIPMIWVETEHFRIGSSLGSYKRGGDRAERTRLKTELSRLKKKLGKLRVPSKSLDPYLRLHIYAQRAEDLYAAFLEDFDLKAADIPDHAPHLGHRNKFLLLLCQKKSEYGRYQKAYAQQVHPFSYRMGWRGDGMVVAVNMESVSEEYLDKDLPFDSMMHSLIANALASCFVDGFEQNMFKAPTWLVYGVAHLYSRRVDPRWPYFDARRASSVNYESVWKWEPRVMNMVKSGYFASAKKMFAWESYGDLKSSDHLIAWSKIEYLITEAKGDPKLFLRLCCNPLQGNSLPNGEEDQERVIRQTRALAEAYGLTPEELDSAWAAWVPKAYRKR